MINQATIKAGVEAAKKGIPMAGQKLADFFSQNFGLDGHGLEWLLSFLEPGIKFKLM